MSRLFTLLLLIAAISTVTSFSLVQPQAVMSRQQSSCWLLQATETEETGIVDLSEDAAPETAAAAAPFMSQGAIDQEAFSSSSDEADPKEARVMIYMIISLIPVLFLIPLMLGSRDLIPLDAIPPVDL